MRNFFLLVKLQFLNLTSGGISSKNTKTKRKKSSMASKFALVLLIGALLAVMGYVYSDIFCQAQLVKVSAIPVLMMALASLVCFMFNFYSVSAVLFNNKDYELLASLPIKKSSIIFSKLALIYVTSFLIALVLVVPALIVAINNGLVITLGYVVRVLMMTVCAPLMIIALAVFIGLALQLAFAKSKFKNLFQTISLIVVFVVLIALSLFLDSGNFVIFTKLYFLYPIAVNGLYSWIDVLIFVAINVGAVALIVLVVCLFYSKINTLLKTGYKNKKFKLGTYQETSKMKTLYKKEFKRLLTVPMYFLNVVIGPFLSIAGVIACAVIAKSVFGGDAKMIEMLAIGLSAVLLFAHSNVPSTSSSISIEGTRFWIIKSLPIDEKQILKSKMSVNIVLNVLPAVISSIIACIFIVPNVYYGIIISVFAVGGSILSGNVGLLLNLRFPKFNWENANQVVKNSMPVFLCVMIAMVFSVLPVLAFWITFIQPIIYMAILAGIVVIAIVVTAILLKTHGLKMLRKIEM